MIRQYPSLEKFARASNDIEQPKPLNYTIMKLTSALEQQIESSSEFHHGQDIMKKNEEAHFGMIFAMCVSPCGTYLFSGDKHGIIKQWNSEDITQKPVFEYKKVSDGRIYCLTCTEKYLWVADSLGKLTQIDFMSFSIDSSNFVHYCAILSIVSTKKYVFTSDEEGYLVQFFITEKPVKNSASASNVNLQLTGNSPMIKKMKSAHEPNPKSLCPTSNLLHSIEGDSEYLSCTKEWGQIHECGIKGMAVTTCSKYLFTCDTNGN